MNPSFDQVSAACRGGDVEALQHLFPDDPTQWRSPEGSSLLQWVVQTSPRARAQLASYLFDGRE
jgi:hypothetical protein